MGTDDNIKSSMKTQALATLAIHKFIAEPVANFKNQHPDWQKTVPKILKQKKKKRKLKVETNENAKNTGKTLDNKTNIESANDSSEGEENENEESSEGESNEEGSGGGESNEDESGGEENSEGESNEDESGGEENSEGESNEDESVGGESSEEDSDYEENNIICRVPDEKGKQEESNEEGDDSEEENYETEDENDTFTESKITFNSEDSHSDEDIQSSSNEVTTEKIIHKVQKRKSAQLDEILPKKLKITKDSKILKNNNKNFKNKKLVNTSIRELSIQKINENKPKVVDPFFMTTTNEEYITSQVPVVNEDNNSNWKNKNEDNHSNWKNRNEDNHSNWKNKNEDSRMRKTNKFNSFDTKSKWSKKENTYAQKRFPNNKPQTFNKPFKNSFDKFPTKPSDRLIISTGNRKERRQALQRPLQEEKAEKLHPSWEAKKKQTSMATFQGKKITFD